MIGNEKEDVAMNLAIKELLRKTHDKKILRLEQEIEMCDSHESALKIFNEVMGMLNAQLAIGTEEEKEQSFALFKSLADKVLEVSKLVDHKDDLAFIQFSKILQTILLMHRYGRQLG